MQFDQLKRRDFITLLGGAAVAWPSAARAQQPERIRRIGVLMSTSAGNVDREAHITALRDALGRFGWVVGKNLHIDYRSPAGDADRLRAMGGELVTLSPDTQSTIVFSRGRLWDVLDDPHLNQALGLPQNPRMTFRPYPKRR